MGSIDAHSKPPIGGTGPHGEIQVCAMQVDIEQAERGQVSVLRRCDEGGREGGRVTR